MARQRKQTPPSIEHIQKSFRLDATRDAALIAWLAGYAERYKQSDIIRLALYVLAGLDAPPELHELLPLPVSFAPPDPAHQQETAASEQLEMLYYELTEREQRASQQLDLLFAELAELREAVSAGPPLREEYAVTDRRRRKQPVESHYTPPDGEQGREVETSGGIDMSRPRARITPGDAPAPPPTLPEADFDPQASARILLDSIHGFKGSGPGT